MRAMVIHRHGGPEELQLAERPVPEPDENQLLVEVHATSVNPVDARVRRGGGAPRKFPLIRTAFDETRPPYPRASRGSVRRHHARRVGSLA